MKFWGDKMQDMEQYKKKVKENIEELINSNALEEAKKIIKEYKELVTNDVDIYSFEAVIAMLEGSMNEAEVILKKGNTIYQYSFDILYNLGYLYESVSNNELAIEYYKKALINCNNENEEYVAYNSLINLGIKDTKGNIISNIIAQKHYEDAIKLDKIGNKSDAALYYGLAYKHSENKELKSRIGDLYSNNESLKDIFNVAAKSKKKRFIILSSCGWSDIYQRMHHISRSLVKLENEVIYIEPNIQANINNEKVSLDALVEHSINNSKIVDGVKIYSPILAIHNEKVISNNYTYLVQNLLDASTNANKTIIVTYMPYQVDVISSLKGNFMHIYDCVDDHSDLDYAFWGNKKDVVLEQELMDKADAITTTATSLYLERVAIEERENVYLSRNAVNEGDFILEDDYMPEDLKNIPEPRIVYTGVVYERYDEKLFYDVVDSNPDKSFVVIGPIQDGMLKQKRNNLYLLGPKKHSELKVYLKHMQIGIVPYIDTADMDIACDSIKQYEYIACGLPVITTYMPESAMDKIYTFLANTKDNFNQAIEKCLNLEINKNTLSCFLAENSWNARATLLCSIADNKIMESERNNLIKNIQNKLTEICTTYNSPIFETLKAMCLSLKDSMEFQDYAEKSYNKAKYRYIERQYLTALLENNNITTFIDVVKNSKNINEELKEELVYNQRLNNKAFIDIISHLCIGKIRKAIMLVNTLKDKNFKNLYKLYIRFLIGEEIEGNDLKVIEFKDNYSPIFKFLQKEVNEKRVMTKNPNKDPFISVIIPTRNSAEVLRHALMTCIEQDYDNYEIIVSDNSSLGNNETKKLVDELNCNKIKYFRTPKEYAMVENYEFAYEKANGEYMIIIGSDDGLLLHCLKTLSKIIKQLNRPLSITWDPIAYGWPKVAINSIKNGLFIPYLTQINSIECVYYTEEILKSVLSFQNRYSVLPMFYYNSIIKRELAEKVKKTTGNIFYATPPDVYTGIVFAYLQKKYIHVNIPMTIGGSSQTSIGIMGSSGLYKGDNKNNTKFELDKMNEMNMDYHDSYVPYFTGEESAVVFAFNMAKKFFLKEEEYNIDRKRLYEVCARYLFKNDKFNDNKIELYNCIKGYGNRNLIEWYTKNYFDNKEFVGYQDYQSNPLNVGYMKNGGLVLNASKFHVTDVFGAAKLYRNILGY
ncbi:glycosyltransferase [Clostridium sporogenes]|uniref:glycosyltransferase n=2 Tax=Clostridium sporogenes TaxID=1509 RepID=UPI002238C2F9|nr:glycosyltransferase [Clostridium sporogenes]MCW6062210.1 glycosyltransferase [Clostridium sporogenes]